MKKNEVPQESNKVLGGARKAMYAVDENGEYTTIASSGWKVEELVTSLAIEDFALKAEAALARARNGQSAPLEFHMYDRRMDVQTLAQSTGLFQWRVRRHLKPSVFKRLKPALLARYAEALGIDQETLTRLPRRRAEAP